MASKLMKRWKGKGKALDYAPTATPGPSATDRGLHTYELLERILLYLDPPDLRQARCVSQAFNEVITRSQPLNSTWQIVPKRYVEEIRMMLFGNPGCGKTTLLRKWINVIYPPGYYDPTTGNEEPNRKQTHIGRRRYIYEVNLWSQLDDRNAMLHQYFRETHTYALVYAADSIASFRAIREWKEMLDSLPDRPNTEPRVLGALIETKSDLKDEREVQASDGVELARQLGCSFLQTSSRTRHNVDRVFGIMAQAYIDARQQGKMGLIRMSFFGDVDTGKRAFLEKASYGTDEWCKSVTEALTRI